MNASTPISLFGYAISLDLTVLALLSCLVLLVVRDQPAWRAARSGANDGSEGELHGCPG